MIIINVIEVIVTTIDGETTVIVMTDGGTITEIEIEIGIHARRDLIVIVQGLAIGTETKIVIEIEIEINPEIQRQPRTELVKMNPNLLHKGYRYVVLQLL